ncbi:MAG: nitroreductase family protein [Anaerovoracaceae bacterium]|jgi:nitroreductase
MNDIIKNMETRRSVRSYSDRAVSKEDLRLIMEAGEYAPSGMGAQDPVMVCITDKDVISRISKLNAEIMGTDSDPFYGAPALIVVFGSRDRRTRCCDGSAAITNMLNAAHSLGIDSCWIFRARESFETEEGRAMMAAWGLPPEQYQGIGNVILGYGDREYPKAAARKDGRIFWVE